MSENLQTQRLELPDGNVQEFEVRIVKGGELREKLRQRRPAAAKQAVTPAGDGRKTKK